MYNGDLLMTEVGSLTISDSHQGGSGDLTKNLLVCVKLCHFSTNTF